MEASLAAQLVKNPPARQETWVRSLGWEDPLEKGTATHSSIPAWRIPQTVQSMGSQGVRHNWVTFTQGIVFRDLTFPLRVMHSMFCGVDACNCGSLTIISLCSTTQTTSRICWLAPPPVMGVWVDPFCFFTNSAVGIFSHVSHDAWAIAGFKDKNATLESVWTFE